MSWMDRDGNTWERCQVCDRKIPYPKSICGACLTHEAAEADPVISPEEQAKTDEYVALIESALSKKG